MPSSKVLFILKKRQSCWGDYNSTPSSGLFNSANFVNEMLQKNNISSQIVEVVDNNDIDRVVTQYKPSYVVIEALWVVPPKFDVLHKLHPNVKWVIRNHSDFSFLSGEGSAMEFMLDYLQFDNVFISSNKESTNDYFKKLVKDVYKNDLSHRIVYLPNYYPINEVYSYGWNYEDPREIWIGCFGAIRPLKNHLNQAIAAIDFADKIGKKLSFHINATRIEGKGDSILKSLKSLFARTRNHKLIEHSWLGREDFLKLLAQMDLSMQCSFSETFNIVAADSISQEVPIVTSSEVSWANGLFTIDDFKTESIVNGLINSYKFGTVNKILNKVNLRNYSKKSEKIWVNYFR